MCQPPHAHDFRQACHFDCVCRTIGHSNALTKPIVELKQASYQLAYHCLAISERFFPMKASISARLREETTLAPSLIVKRSAKIMARSAIHFDIMVVSRGHPPVLLSILQWGIYRKSKQV